MFYKMKTVSFGAVAAAVFLFVAAPVHAVPSVVTSLAAFNAAIGGASTTTDPFANNIAGGVSITFDSGVTSTLADGNLSSAGSHNRVSGGTFDGALDADGNNAALTLTWDFPAPVIGVGFDAISANFIDIRIAGSGIFFDIGTKINGSSGFFGIVDTAAPFTSIEFSIQGATATASDFFSIDNLIFAAAPARSVPEPGTLALFGLGLAGLGLGAARRRRRLQHAAG